MAGDGVAHIGRHQAGCEGENVLRGLVDDEVGDHGIGAKLGFPP
jgi:hypothetical protein